MSQDSSIANLPAASTITGAEVVPIDQGQTKRATVTQLLATPTAAIAAETAARIAADNTEATTRASADTTITTNLAASSGSSLVGFLQAGTGVVARTVQSKERDIVSVFDFMTAAQIADVQAGTLTLDTTAAIQAAITAVAVNGGSVYAPPGNYKTIATITKPTNVSLFGSGIGTLFSPVSCDFLSFNSGADQQNAFVRDFSVNGTTCTTNTAFKSLGTADRTIITTGQHISGINISNYQTAMNFRNFHDCSIKICWGQNINRGIIIAGQDQDVEIEGNVLVLSSGCGSGATLGIQITSTSDYNPGGITTLLPESIHVTGNNLVFGFTTGISVLAGTYINILDNDVEATATGIEYTTIGSNLNIKDNYVEVDGAAATFGIHGNGLAAAVDTAIINIEGNNVIATGAVTAVGIQLNGTTAGGVENANQTNVRIAGNLLTGWTVADIYMNSAGDIDIIGNRCRSAITNSILIKNALASRPITIDQNRCAGNIDVPNANTPLAQMVVGANYGLFSTYIRGSSTITNGTATVTTTYASLTPTTNNFDTLANTGFNTKLFLGAPSTASVGSLSGTASATQVVINSSANSVGSTVIPWEVRAVQQGLG